MRPEIQYTLEHSSHGVPVELRPRIALTDKQLHRFSDYDTLASVPRHANRPISARYSRLVGDLNRAPDHLDVFPSKDFAKPQPNALWKAGQELTDEEKAHFLELHHGYHEQILDAARKFKRTGLVIPWHNTAHYVIGKNEAVQDQIMPAIILSNMGEEDSADGRNTTCPPELLRELALELRLALKRHEFPDEITEDIRMNLVYKGGYTTQRYSTLRNPSLDVDERLYSVQMEYGTHLTNNQDTLEPFMEDIMAFRAAFTEAIERVYKSL